MFLDMLERGLAYRKEGWVNWDPVDQTVLANEQVIDGRGWRSGAVVERRKLAQWFFRTTAYAEQLQGALDRLERWPEKVRLMQRNWIGKSAGARVRFGIVGRDEPLEIFTTRPDTLFGASFLAIAPDHPLAAELALENPELSAFIAECLKGGTSAAELETQEKRGFDTGLSCRHPFAPATDLPLYVANFVLMEYGTGAIFGCPAHDQRDLEFARQVRPAGDPRRPPARRRPRRVRDRRRGLRRRRHALPLGLPRRPRRRGRQAPRHRRAGAAALGRGRDHLSPSRLGRLAPALLGLPDPGDPLRALRRRPGAARAAARHPARGRRLRRPRQPARPAPDLEARRVPVLRRPGLARDRHLRHLRRELLVLRPLLLARRRRAAVPARRGRLLAARRPVHRRRRARDPAPALRALLHPRHVGLRPARPGRAVRRPLHAGHGHPPHLPRRARRLARAGRGGARRGRRLGHGRRPPPGRRPAASRR